MQLKFSDKDREERRRREVDGDSNSQLLAEIGDIKKPIHIQLTYRTFFKMEKFLKESRLDSYSKAIEKLIDIALILQDDKDEIENKLNHFRSSPLCLVFS